MNSLTPPSPLPPGASPRLPPSTLATSSNSRPAEVVQDRYLCRELMEGFPVHRDACEWAKLRNLFADDEACQCSFLFRKAQAPPPPCFRGNLLPWLEIRRSWC